MAQSVPLFRSANETDELPDGADRLWQDQVFANLIWIRWGRTNTSVRFGTVVESAIERVLRQSIAS